MDEMGHELNVIIEFTYSIMGNQEVIEKTLRPSCKSFTLLELQPKTTVKFVVSAISSSGARGPSNSVLTSTDTIAQSASCSILSSNAAESVAVPRDVYHDVVEEKIAGSQAEGTYSEVESIMESLPEGIDGGNSSFSIEKGVVTAGDLELRLLHVS